MTNAYFLDTVPMQLKYLILGGLHAVLSTKLSTACVENIFRNVKKLLFIKAPAKLRIKMAKSNIPEHSVNIAHRKSFSVVKASGKEVLKYLQGQLTQDVKKLSESQALYSVILNPQAKAITELYLLQGEADEVVMICPQLQAVRLVERLRQFSLGYQLRVGVVSSWQVQSVQGEAADDFLLSNNLPVPDSSTLSVAKKNEVFVLRMPEAANSGVWLIGSELNLEANVEESDLIKLRVLKGVPTFGVDWDENIHPLNANLIERNGVSFDKGCYVGQEVTSRMQWRGGIKKKLYRVEVEAFPEILPCPIQTTVNIGMLTSLATNERGHHLGIALLPIETVEADKSLTLEGRQRVTVLGVCH